MPRPIPDTALDLIREFEGLRLDAYQDGAGIYTIGWGHTLDVLPGDHITAEKAQSFLIADAQWAAAAVEKLVVVPLTENQFGALVSFVFNLGAAAFGGSTLLRRINQCEYLAAADEFGRWIHDHAGNIEPGLIRRRSAERALWLT